MSDKFHAEEATHPWRCLRTKPKSEQIAAGFLAAQRGIEVFNPRIRHRKATARGPVWFTEALFPGYLFARCHWSLHQRQILATTGVTGMVHFGPSVPEVPTTAVADLRAHFPETGILTVQPAITVGDQVEVSTGPFQGARATITRLLPAAERVAILIEFLGGSRELEVPLAQILGLVDARSWVAAAAC